LSRHNREIAEIRAVQKRTEDNIAKLTMRTEESIRKLATAHARETAEIWVLMGKLVRGTEAAQQATVEIRDIIRDLATEVRGLAVAQKRTEASLQSLIDSRRAANGHKKR